MFCGKNIIHYLQSTITLKNIIKFVVFNESPLGVHLWYLGAVFYVLLIVFFFGQIETEKNTIYFSTFSTYH